MIETNISSTIEGDYKVVQVSPKSVSPVFETRSETCFFRAVSVPENGKTALIRIVPRTPRPTEFQSRTD